MKKTFYTLSFIFLVGTTAFAQKMQWIPFNWEGDSLGGKYFDKVAMTIPVNLDDMPYKMMMQFDLGAMVTVVYGNPMAPFLAKNPQFASKIDTTMTFRMQSQTNPKFKDVALKLGNVSFGKRNIGLFRNFGDSIRLETINSPIEKLIGTIAPDLFENRILVIDYPHKRLCVVDELPRKMKKATFQDMKIQEGRIKIPFSVGDSTYDVMFDTGSSIFDMMTDAENLKKCTLPNTPISDSLKISSWGNFFYVYSMPFNKPFRFGKKSFLNAKVYFSKGADELNFNREEKILGITGNALFLNNTVIIDYKRKKFGVL